MRGLTPALQVNGENRQTPETWRLILTKPVGLTFHGLGLSHMTVEQYFILQDNNEWKISFNDKLYGPYDTQQDAVEAAIDAAYAMGEIGIDAQVPFRL